MNKKLRKAITAVLALILIGSTAMLIFHFLQYREAKKTYDQAAELAGVPDLSEAQIPDSSDGNNEDDMPAPSGEASGDETSQVSASPKAVYKDPYAELLKKMDFTALRKVNGEIRGWILIPSTPISYPILRGTDNSYYLTHTYNKGYSIVGSIFMDSRNSGGFSDFNTVIYGHRMNDGSMFASLKYYVDQGYWESHPNIYITDDSGTHRYAIFAACEVSAEGEAYELSFSSDTQKKAFINDCTGMSEISTGIIPGAGDRILTLSTCTGNGHETRWVVQAVLRA